MKSQLFVPVWALCMLSGLFNPLQAQFYDAIVTETSVGLSPVMAVHTSNYIYDSGGTTFIVNVNDDNGGPNAIMSWEVGSSTGFINIEPSASIVDPDVCIVKNAGGVVYAIVAYYDANASQFKIRSFQWQTGSLQFTAGNVDVLENGTFETSINIDGGDQGDFAVVWDQPGQQVQLKIGQTPGWSAPQLVFPGSSFNLEAGTMPDVCFYRNSANNDKQVDVVYKNVGGYVAVDFYRYNELLAGIVNFNPEFRSPAADLNYKFPRIDCPAPGFGTIGSFTVVVEDSDNNTFYIKGFNKHSCCPGYTTHIYNDGTTSNSPYNLTDVPNTRPVVAYQNNGDGIVVGWNVDNSFGLLSAPGAGIGKYPIALSCDKKAGIHSASKYLYVPFNVPYGSELTTLSISGKYSVKELYTFLNESNNELFYKSLPHVTNASYLRTDANDQNFYSWLDMLTASDHEEGGMPINFSVYDITGREVYHSRSAAGEVHKKWKLLADKMQPGVYGVIATGNQGIHNFSGKVFINR